jgi:pimeloyl-ACP methyl ester carboxylesterase
MTGILEPFQTETTLDGQVQELRSVIRDHGTPPVTLIGFSWGAYLGWLLAARYPELVRKLILVSAPPFEEKYAAAITQRRMKRLNKKEREQAQALLSHLNDDMAKDKNRLLAELGSLLSRADAYDPANLSDEGFHCQYDVFKGVWDEACELRQKEIILHMAKAITCPVVAIHGDTDPHPAEGVNDPLARELADFRFVLLEKCGHRPWAERYAAEEFFERLAKEI